MFNFDKEKYIQHISDVNTKELISKTLDKIIAVLKNHEVKFTDFLNPYEQQCLVQIVNSFTELDYKTIGGYGESERKVLAIFQNYLTHDLIDIPITAIEIKTKADNKISHRDVLGSVLGLGIKREKVGDILIHDDCFQIIIHKVLEDYVLVNLTKIGRVNVKVNRIDLNKLKPMKIEYKKITGFLASLRLDAVVSFAFKVHRSEAQSLIKKERVTINWEMIQKNDYILSKQDIISVRGKGKVIIEDIGGRTKSDRIKVLFKKPI